MYGDLATPADSLVHLVDLIFGLQYDRPTRRESRVVYILVLVLERETTEDGNDGSWPYDRDLAAMRPETWAWAQAHLKLVERFELPGLRMALFERPDLP